MRELKGIPDAVKRWAFCEMPGVKAFMVYKKKGRRAEAFCTCCGAYVEGITEAVSLEDEAETLIRPEHNTESRCPRCHVIGQWKAKGRMTRSCFRTFYYIFGQKIKDDFVFRACTCTLTIFPDTICQIEDSEYARVYLSKGKKAEKWWHVCRYGEWQWVDWYPGYFGSGGITRDHYYPGTYDSIRKTPMLKYGNPRSWDPIDYYSAFARYPDMEMVQKLGMDDLTRALIYQRGANINPRGKTIWDRLRINKDRLKDLQKKKGSIFYLKTYQLERKEERRPYRNEGCGP